MFNSCLGPNRMKRRLFAVVTSEKYLEVRKTRILRAERFAVRRNYHFLLPTNFNVGMWFDPVSLFTFNHLV